MAVETLYRGHRRRALPDLRRRASTRCWRPSSIRSTSRGAGSTPAGSGPWASACPAAMGVQARLPGRAGGLHLRRGQHPHVHPGDWPPARSTALPIKVILLNNGYMGMVRQWQEFFYESRYSHSYVDALPDFVKLGRELRPCRDAHREAGATWKAPCARPSQLKDRSRLPRCHRGSQRKRLPDDRGRQGPPRDAPGAGTMELA